MDLGYKKIYFKNIEDITSIHIYQVNDIFEISLNETYYEITKRELVHGLRKGFQRDGIYKYRRN